MGLFQLGAYTLHGGQSSHWKIECDALTQEDWLALAGMVRQMVGPFSCVFGVPEGGSPLAIALSPYRIQDLVLPKILIVDDVLTTGDSMNLYREEKVNAFGGFTPDRFIGAVVFARGPCPAWVTPLFQMPSSLRP